MQETYTDWTLVSLSPLSPTLFWSLVAAVLLATLRVLWSYRHARARAWLMPLRAVAALLVLGFLVEPAVQLRAVRKIKNRLAVVVDRSRSMGLDTVSGQSRYQAVLATLDKSREKLTQLQKSHIIDWYDLDGPLASTTLQQAPTAEHTDLLTALEHAREAGAGRPLAGVLLISDGADNADIEGKARGTLSDSAQARLGRLGAPVNTANAAAAAHFQDVAITGVLTDDFAFVQNTFDIEVHLESTGFGRVTVPVTLRREGDILATQEAVLSDDAPQKVLFKTKPDKIGDFVYTVDIPAVAGEAVRANNQYSFVLQVIRDKIRVLQVVGHPSWDERFLRQHLKENPNADLISFFILRTPTDDNTISETELSLIPFPVDKLFTTELRSFDVVIFQDFDYRPYHMAHFLPNIRNAVMEGLGFVMLGGEESFAEGGYVGTALEDILPIRLGDGGIKKGGVAPALTEAGRRHPVTDLTRGAASNDQAWSALPQWSFANRTAGLVPNATALVVDKTAPDNGRSLPLISVMDVGQGRSMAIATNNMWRWRFASERDGGAATRAYNRFWSNALRWLVRDPEHARVRVLPDKRRYDVSDKQEVTFVVLGRDYQPVPFAKVRAVLSRAGNTEARVDEVVAGENGTARKLYTQLEAGAYRLSATATEGGQTLGEGSGVFVVESRSRELTRSAPRPDLLAAVSETTGGRQVALSDDMWEKLKLIDPDVVNIDRRRNVELWDNAWALACAVGLLALEWAVRRRNGYL